MIVGYTLDCGCVFARHPDHKFRMSHSCVKHSSPQPAPEPYKCPRCGQRIEDGLPCGCGARGVLKQTPFGELLCAEDFD